MPVKMNAALVMLLLPALAASIRLARVNNTGAGNLSAAVAVDADDTALEGEIHSLVSGFHKVEAELRANKADPNPKRRQARQRFFERVKGEVDTVLPREVKQLEAVFGAGKAEKSVAHPKASRAERTAAKIARRKVMITDKKDASECGQKILASSLGLKTGIKAAHFFGQSFLQMDEPEEEEYISVAIPGAGADQKMKDEGRSTMGQMKGEEPFVTVYKDGFWQVGCVNDVMFTDYDKFGDNKFKYGKDATYVNVSVAVYKELVLEEAQKPLKSQICFEFCRTLDNMAFFGLQNGQNCYCMPYYKTVTGGEGDMCDLPCPGNDLEMCGGPTKSTIYEMHTCGDKGGQLAGKAVKAGESLSAFYASALVAQTVAKDVQVTAEIIQEVAGQAGDPDTSDLMQVAKTTAGDLQHVMANGACVDDYNLLLTTYEEAEAISLLNMKNAKNLQKANDAEAVMDEQIPKVDKCTADAGMPKVYQDVLDAASTEEYNEKQEAYATAIASYLPMHFVLKNKDKPAPTTCTGEILGAPSAANLAECAQACDDMVFPEKCVAFQYYHASGTTESSGNLCFLYKEIKKLIVYKCEFTSGLVDGEKDRVKAAAEGLLQSNSSVLRKDEPEEEEEEKITKIEASMCDNVLESLSYSAMTCPVGFGEEGSVKDTCSAVCERSKGPKYAAVCMSKFSEISGATPGLEIKEKDRCFAGAKNEEVDGPKAGPQLIPFDEHGAVLAGDVMIGKETILEPIIWTVSEEEEA